MLHTLVVGIGRSGRDLHLPVVHRLRESGAGGALFADSAPMGYDALPPPVLDVPAGLEIVPTLAAAAALRDPARTVVHLCTPPTARVPLLHELAALGYRRLLVEKPLGADTATVAELRRARDAYGLDVAVVGPWLHSSLTERLATLVGSGRLGALRRVTVHQRKPRLGRTLRNSSHPTAFDVEPPHSVGVALRLAGGGRVTAAEWSDATDGRRVAPRMGSAGLTLRHDGGVVTTIDCDLVAPVRERSILLEFDAGTALGHYPVSGDDPYGQLRVTPLGMTAEHEIFHDQAMDACLLHAYRAFADGADLAADFELQAHVVELLEQAKRRAEHGEPAGAAAGPGKDGLHAS
ncbi:hypothetical protein [Streptomyces sp. WMMC897]|uniref:hypothetical protein n=1 Tax=Streptomyces sp. WMMC897 TaxID=3014782 RepID=UPI0022B67203|nr:hypothetical protein [Streptomyces sp. WMMC897]MCZ7414541.1 hypothetical protein [Streptomyces sp. WMMC897]